MPVTRQQGVNNRGTSTTEETTTSQSTTDESAATSGTVTTESTDRTGATATSVSTATSLRTGVTAQSVTQSNAPTLPVDPAHRPTEARAPASRTDTLTLKPIEASQHSEPHPPKKRGGALSSKSKMKARKLAKAQEELLQLQVKLAAARVAAMQDDDTDEELEDDGASDHAEIEALEQVDDWLKTHPPRTVLAITDTEHFQREQSATETVQQKPAEERRASGPQPPAGGHLSTAEMVEAFALAIKSSQQPKYVELPAFGGSYYEWLPFRAAYFETEKSFTEVENMNRLRKNLKGKAKDSVEGLLCTGKHPLDVMSRLESRFGRPEAIAAAQLKKLRELPRLPDTAREICIYSNTVSNVIATLQALHGNRYLHETELARSIIDKFNTTLRHQYYDFASLQSPEEPELVKIEAFLRKRADCCAPYAEPEDSTPRPTVSQPKRLQRAYNVSEKDRSKCPICEEGHACAECEQFSSMELKARWEAAKGKHLCFRCLRHRDRSHRCPFKACGIDGCKISHHKLLHYVKRKLENSEQSEPAEQINSAWTMRQKQSYLKIIPLQVKGPAGVINTHALLDDGSTVTLIEDSVANCIGATGPVDPLNIATISDEKTSESTSRRVNVTLMGTNHREERIQARTVKNLHIASQRVSTETVNSCKHLAGIRKYLTYTDAQPRVLIGQDNWHLLIAKKVKRGTRAQPAASLTPLGWVLHGSQTRSAGRSPDFVSHVAETVEDDLGSLVKQYFEMDALCIPSKKPKTDPEQRALRVLESNTTKTENGQYETGLLWKKEEFTLPDNYDNSLKRLFNIEKKIDRDPKLKQKYTEQMDALVTKGYAELAPTQKTTGRTWYLPHFAVVNPMKPEKLRVVHDAAAKTRGVALNDMLLKGPDLLQSLPGVVMRFRQHRIAVTADIKEMFMQVKLKHEDRDALRYLWRGGRRDSQPPDEYRMTSLIFGASSSPSTAIYIKNLNAKQHESTHPEAAAAIVKKHYVDDYLDSFENIEDAIRVTNSVRNVHSKAHFELKQWKSNSPRLLEALGEIEPSGSLELYKPEEQIERVLGVVWKTHTDDFTFNLDLERIAPDVSAKRTPTKREALRIVMSLFDPLGFASPVTIRAKQLLQEVWRRGTGWDDQIEEDLATQWQEWMVHLKNLHNITIPRRYLHYSDATSLQLHVFTDASEAAYSTVLYWRAVTPNGDIGLSLIMAKAKVAPLKLTSIPRLELQAATMGTILAETVIEEHEKKPDSKVFWTDSKTVLSWIRTGPRAYKPYVAHRLAAIEDTTTVNEWRWVPTKLNVADDATRDVPDSFDHTHRWYRGPDFLRAPEQHWPTETTVTGKQELSGEERVHQIVEKRQEALSEALPDVSRFSNWNRLKYATARVLQFIQLCRPNSEKINYRRTRKNAEKDPDWRKNNKPNSKPRNNSLQIKREQNFLPVTAEQLRRAEQYLMRLSQEESFTCEIDNLRNNRKLNKESRLYQLSTEYVDGAVRIRSRIRATQGVTDNFKSPMVLDGDHKIVKLWIEFVHRQLHHAGIESTVNECRQHYWVLRVRPATRMLIRRCLYCRIKTQTPPYPRTGDLPACRLAHHQRPFTFTGVDYFGPLSVTVGRARQKRYVAIFTCLTTRAVHLEVAGSLTADSAVMSLRRMIARRGQPTEIWSDNGTNLKAADKELRRALDDATAAEAAKKTISWRYIPPGAPFMGGAWERMVRSVKTALTATLHERYPTEEVLTTLLAEVEYTVNSRPLTHVSVSAEDPEALTPNHFLMGGSGRVQQPGTFDDNDVASRSSWRSAQRLADIFWTRWVKEYLPELQHRREPHGRGPAVQVNDLVQIVDANLPRNVWIRGRVVASYPGPDNIVRTVDIQTKGGILRRPVRKLIILPVNQDAPAPERGATFSHGGSDVRDDLVVK